MRVPARPLEDYAGLSTPSTRVPGAAFLRRVKECAVNFEIARPNSFTRRSRAPRRGGRRRWTPTPSPLLATEPGRAAIAHAMARLDAGLSDLAVGEDVRRQFPVLPPQVASAAVEQATLRTPRSGEVRRRRRQHVVHRRRPRTGNQRGRRPPSRNQVRRTERHSRAPTESGRLVLRNRRRPAGTERRRLHSHRLRPRPGHARSRRE